MWSFGELHTSNRELSEFTVEIIFFAILIINTFYMLTHLCSSVYYSKEPFQSKPCLKGVSQNRLQLFGVAFDKMWGRGIATSPAFLANAATAGNCGNTLLEQQVARAGRGGMKAGRVSRAGEWFARGRGTARVAGERC
jgi:hypothetical protein